MSKLQSSKAVLLRSARSVSFDTLLKRGHGCYIDLDILTSPHASGIMALETLEDYIEDVRMIVKSKYPNLCMTLYGCDWDGLMHINDCPGNYFYHLLGKEFTREELYSKTPKGAYKHIGYRQFPSLGYKGHIWMEGDLYMYEDYIDDRTREQHTVLIEIFRSIEDSVKRNMTYDHFVTAALYSFIRELSDHIIVCDHFIALDVQRLLRTTSNVKIMQEFTADYNYAIYCLAETAGHLGLIRHTFEYDVIWD